jgi:hypothetical protein
LPALSFRLQPIALGFHASETCLCANGDPTDGIVAESPSQYHPRHPERSAFYQLFETHDDSYVRAHEERFEPRSGPLRPVVVRSVEEFLSCGRLQGGFARIRCTKCHAEHLLAYSCRTRNFCSSCQAKRSVLFAEKLIFEADPLLCSCGARMRIVSFITDPRAVDRILRHLESARSKAQDPFEPRAPPAAAATIRQ